MIFFIASDYSIFNMQRLSLKSLVTCVPNTGYSSALCCSLGASMWRRGWHSRYLSVHLLAQNAGKNT